MKTNFPNAWDLEQILALSYIKKVGVDKRMYVINEFSSFYEWCDSVGRKTQQDVFIDEKNNKESVLDKSKQQIGFCDANNFNIITYWDDEYPELLKHIYAPPIFLFVRGELQQSDAMSISVVGTRKCDTYGRIVAENFVTDFVKAGLVITSGMATGIDTIAHTTALKNGGITYAVIASGLDKISSSISKKLADEIVESGGAIISQFKCGTGALPPFFLIRNGVISGISKAVLVVESAIKGGAMNTITHAIDQNREVFAVPGSVFSDKSAGCNALIQDNRAAIATSSESIIRSIIPIANSSKIDAEEQIQQFDSIEEEIIYNNLFLDEPIQIDNLSQKTNIEISELLVYLLEMEFKGLIKQLPGKHYVKKNN